MPLDLSSTSLVSGLLTGLVYGLMALGLSVIFGVVRVVNFAHGEMMALAMYLRRCWLRRAAARSARAAAAGRARCSSSLGYALQRGADQPVHRPARARAVHAAARGRDDPGQRPADGRSGPTRAACSSTTRSIPIELGPLLVDKVRVVSPPARRWSLRAAAVRVLPLHAHRQGDPRLRRQPRSARAWSGSNVKQLYALTFGIGAACVGVAGALMIAARRRDAGARARRTRCSPSSSSSSAASARWPARCSGGC